MQNTHFEQQTIEMNVISSEEYCNFIIKQVAQTSIIPPGLSKHNLNVYCDQVYQGLIPAISEIMLSRSTNDKIKIRDIALHPTIVFSQLLILLSMRKAEIIKKMGINSDKMGVNHLANILISYSSQHPISRHLILNNYRVKVNADKLNKGEILKQISQKKDEKPEPFKMKAEDMSAGYILYQQLRGLLQIVEQMNNVRNALRQFTKWMSKTPCVQISQLLAIILKSFKEEFPNQQSENVPARSINFSGIAHTAKSLFSTKTYKSILEALVTFRRHLMNKTIHRRDAVIKSIKSQDKILSELVQGGSYNPGEYRNYFIRCAQFLCTKDKDGVDMFKQYMKSLKNAQEFQDSQKIDEEENAQAAKVSKLRDEYFEKLLVRLKLRKKSIYHSVPVGMIDQGIVNNENVQNIQQHGANINLGNLQEENENADPENFEEEEDWGTNPERQETGMEVEEPYDEQLQNARNQQQNHADESDEEEMSIKEEKDDHDLQRAPKPYDKDDKNGGNGGGMGNQGHSSSNGMQRNIMLARTKKIKKGGQGNSETKVANSGKRAQKDAQKQNGFGDWKEKSFFGDIVYQKRQPSTRLRRRNYCQSSGLGVQQAKMGMQSSMEIEEMSFQRGGEDESDLSFISNSRTVENQNDDYQPFMSEIEAHDQEMKAQGIYDAVQNPDLYGLQRGGQLID